MIYKFGYFCAFYRFLRKLLFTLAFSAQQKVNEYKENKDQSAYGKNR